MLSMICYVVIVSLLLSVAALAAEYAAKQRGSSKRWIWMVTIVGSLLLPLVIPNVTVRIPDLIKPANTDASVVLRDATFVHLPAAVLNLDVPETAAQPHLREQKPKADVFAEKLGPETSHEFIGVTPQGWDKYLVRHKNGNEEVGFLVDSNGTIVSAFRH